MKKEEKLKITKYLVSAALAGVTTGYAIVGGVALHSKHSNTNHLTTECPFAFIYGDKVIEHSINEVQKHKETVMVKTAPVGYTLDPKTGRCVKETLNNVQSTIDSETGKQAQIITNNDEHVMPTVTFYDTYYNIPSECYGIDNSFTSNSVNDQIEEQVKSLYR